MNPAHRDRIAFVRICSGSLNVGWVSRLRGRVNHKVITIHAIPSWMIEAQ